MEKREHCIEDEQALDQVLGYLNFSSGAPDTKFLANLNRLWATTENPGVSKPFWRAVTERLQQRLNWVARNLSAFHDARQAQSVLGLIENAVLPSYFRFHENVLFHQKEDDVVNALFWGRVGEAVLRQGGPWEEGDRVTKGTIHLLNDFVGYRPVPVLETRRIEPFPHERIRPVPLWIQGVGAAWGPYQRVVTIALELLARADKGLLHDAQFDLDLLDELSFDPRAYDFDHPANKRPNYHFGQWDPHLIDRQGRYRRFVVQQVTLDALMQRPHGDAGEQRSELEYEAAAVLAGTILMASGVSGSGPDTYDSETTLTKLLPRIAAYRDAFYERLLEQTRGSHGESLRSEAKERRQPFGGARQHLNAQLARRRASQLEHVQLAGIFARLGYPDEAAQHAEVVPCASARLLCKVDCRLTAVSQAIDHGQLEPALVMIGEVMKLIHVGIECGAIVDPWSILGFDAQFSLFPAAENSVHDHRVDELIDRIERLLGHISRLWSEAAALDNRALSDLISTEFKSIATWWRQFAAHEISSVAAIDPIDAFHAAEHVARALNLWHKGGAAAGDIGFWARHAEMFDSPQAYALVIDALIHHGDFVASMGLLIQWLSQGDRIPLEKGNSSFHELVLHWLRQMSEREARNRVEAAATSPQSAQVVVPAASMSAETWRRIRRFFECLEANAGNFGTVPEFVLAAGAAASTHPSDEPQRSADDEPDLFEAAYENVVFRDSADDGIEGAVFESDAGTNDELTRESERLIDRLAYFHTLAGLWRIVALLPIRDGTNSNAEIEPLRTERDAALERWVEHARQARIDLLNLLDVVHRYPIRVPATDHDSMVEYDRLRVVKESLLERIIAACVDMTDASRILAAAHLAEKPSPLPDVPPSKPESEEALCIGTFAALLRRDAAAARKWSGGLDQTLAELPLLYVPLAKNGDPRDIVSTRARQRYIQELLKCMPRLGLIVETCHILETARDMERNHPVGSGAVTEFDELFKIGYRAVIECLMVSFESWKEKTREKESELTAHIINQLEKITESMLVSWLAHSRTLRLSVLEKVNEKRTWLKVVEFIENYGGELFSQRFLNLGNIRAILHQGVGNWLRRMEESDAEHERLNLLDALERDIPRDEAAERLAIILESIVENYGEYRDYNSTTTQSDRGELLYSLLDFLRLRAKYDRVCWNLKPVVLAHEILVRRGHKQAAQVWRRALRDRIGTEADKFQQKLAELQKKYAMQMPSIADRISERFLRPLSIDRLCALVRPAAVEARQQGARPSCRMLKVEIESLTREPSGVGFDIPAWLVALEEEVQRVTDPQHHRNGFDELEAAIPYIALHRDDIQRQIDDWTAD